MNRTEKEAFVTEFRRRLERAAAVYLTDFTGVDVKGMTVLRAELKQSGGEFLVAKNRLMKLAIAGTELAGLEPALIGPTGVVFGYEGVVEPAKAVSEFAKLHRGRPVFKLGALHSEILTPGEIERLVKLPRKEQLLAQLAGVLQAPAAALAFALEAKLREAAGLFEALRDERLA